MKKLMIGLFILFSIQLFAQGPGYPFNPMTAPGAEGVHGSQHILKWRNPIETVYNEVYFSDDSLLVANLSDSVKVLNGYPNTAYTQIMPNFVNYDYLKKYYWRIVEHDSSSFTIGPVWYFRTRIWPGEIVEENFDDLNLWTKVGPLGLNNWDLSFLGFAAGDPPELVFNYSPLFTGKSYIRMNKLIPGGYGTYIRFNHFIYWFTDTVTVGMAYTTNNGISWTSIWEKKVTNSLGEQILISGESIPEIFNIGFYYSGNSSNINNWYIDNLYIGHPIETYNPPNYLAVKEDTSIQKVTLNWSPGYAPSPTLAYQIMRKDGLPTDTNSYYSIGYTCYDSLSFEDSSVEQNHTYTYRLHTRGECPYFMGRSIGSNEATAYVPAIIPVELISFSSSINENNVTLNWQTATETNNAGFEIQRKRVFSPLSSVGNEGWKVISFINGNGTTTEPQSYSFVDENLAAGKYQYRLKQIDFDGTFEYSDIIEIEINPPAKFSLSQNYPNPFNPSTKIHFTIPTSPLNPSPYQGEGNRERFVTLKVFDVLGKEVATLVNEEKPAGSYEVEFNSVETLHATSLPSGVYFYQLRAGDPSTGSGQVFIETKKMILLR